MKIILPSGISVAKHISYLLLSILLLSLRSMAQVSTPCLDPVNTIYGLTGNGAIYPIDVTNATTGTVVKNTTYSGNSASSANGIGYNPANNRFYYFKRNVNSSSQEFVSFNPLLNTVTILAGSTCLDDVHTGCISVEGTGYYTIDTKGALSYYNIINNTWTLITTSLLDQDGNNVTSVIQTQSAGDMASDGFGNLWVVSSSSSNYGLYKIPVPLPKTAVPSLTVTRVINPTSATPTGNSFAGIAFTYTGQIYMGTKSDNRLYRLENNQSLTFIGTFNRSDVGNDLTSCNFPTGVLPVTWLSFTAEEISKATVELKWEVTEQNVQGYYPEWSADGIRWEAISYVQPAENSDPTKKYSFVHNAAFFGKKFYRIKQKDSDGKVTYSSIRDIAAVKDNLAISIWPNPASSNIQIKNSSSNEFTKATLFGLTGTMIRETSLINGTIRMDIGHLKPGVYILFLLNKNGETISQKIVKQ